MSYALQLPTKYARGVQIPGNQGYAVDVEPGWENERRIYYVKYTATGMPYMTSTTTNVVLYHPDVHLGAGRYVLDLDRVDTMGYLQTGSGYKNGGGGPYFNSSAIVGTAIKQWITADTVHASTTNTAFVYGGVLDNNYLPGTPFIVSGLTYLQYNGSFIIDAVGATGVQVAPSATLASHVFTGSTLTIQFAAPATTPPYLTGQSVVLAGWTVSVSGAGLNAQWQVNSCTTTQVVLNCSLAVQTVTVAGTISSYGYVRYKHPYGYTPGTASVANALTFQYNSFEWEKNNAMYFAPEFNTRIALGETRLCVDGVSTGIGSYKDVRLTKQSGFNFGDLGTTYFTGTVSDPATYNDSFGYGNTDANRYKRAMSYSNPWCTLTSSTQAMVIPNDTMNFSFTMTDAPLALTKAGKQMLYPDSVVVDKTYYFTIRPNPVF
jgi:hypothetical protein